MSALRIYHNPRCSKSRAACDILAERGLTAEVVNYLETPLTRAALSQLLRALTMTPLELIRTGEAVFKEHYAGKALSDDEWMDALLAHPILMERPIVMKGERAVVARPPERLLEILD